MVSVAQEFRTTCTVDLKYFPFDRQTCVISYMIPMPSEIYSLKTDMHASVPPHLIFEANTEWEQVEAVLSNTSFKYELVEGFYEIHSGVNVTISMRRLPNFYIMYLVIPSFLISAVTVLVFALPPESGERIGLSITSLLSYTVFLLMVSEVTPRGGQYIPVLGELLIKPQY